MLSKTKIVLAVVALTTLVVGAAALLLKSRSALKPGVTFSVPEAKRTAEDRSYILAEPQLAAYGEREAVQSAEASTSESAQIQQQPGEPPKFGSIVGSVFDFNGKPLANRSVVFYEPGDLDTAQRLRARSDQNGYFTVDKIPVGHWTAYYLGTQGSQEASLLQSGEVDVWENQTASWNFVLLGERNLSGTFTLRQEDLMNLGVPKGHGVSLQLELHSRWQPDVIVAKGRAQTIRTAPDDVQYDPSKADGLEHPRGVGRFEMTGLAAGQYTLRIMVPGKAKDPSTGQANDLFIDREIDLVQGDVALPGEELTFAQFVEVSRKRR